MDRIARARTVFHLCEVGDVLETQCASLISGLVRARGKFRLELRLERYSWVALLFRRRAEALGGRGVEWVLSICMGDNIVRHGRVPQRCRLNKE